LSVEIGAVINAKEITTKSINQIKTAGFRTIDIFFWESLAEIDLNNLAKIMYECEMPVSCLSIFGNPLREDLKGEEIRQVWKTLIKDSSLFGNPYVSGFAGRKYGTSVTDSLLSWKIFFSGLLEYSYKKNSKGILFENCRMGDTWKNGKWNIAINPDAWELMFDKINDEKMGLQWEPCHQVEAFVDPLKQLDDWMPRIKHIHGKDGKIDYNLLKEKGYFGKDKVFKYTLPGCGDTKWGNIFEILNRNNYNGCVDLEFQGEPFIPNIIKAKNSLTYLKRSRASAVYKLKNNSIFSK
jgi:sugar phosphate isomerase/epimerase